MNLAILRSDQIWKWVLWAGIGIFILTRLLTLTSFPIFNDEAIYLQYSQYIHEDFDKYKLISAGGNAFRDWKPPLQYWFGSVFMGLTEDPLIAGRLASFFVSLFGVFGIYLFVRELLGKKEAAVATLLYALIPPAIFFNTQFIAETFVFSLAPWMYWSFLRAIRPDKLRLQYVAVAVVFGALILLSKQSGMVYVLFSLLLPLTVLNIGGKNSEGEKTTWNWRGFFIRLAVVVGSIVAILILRRMGLSAESLQFEKQFNVRWLMSVQELLLFPVETWRTNFLFIRDYYYHYYSVFILAPILYFFFVTAWRRDTRSIAIGLGFLGGSAAVLFLLRGFNEYIYNTAVIVFLIPLLASAFFTAWNDRSRKIFRVASALVLVSFALLLAHWIYQATLMKVSPADYVRRSTPWAMANYIDNWSGGFGVAEAVARVKEQETPVLVFADPQWGNPRTALEVYTRGLPETRIIGLTQDFLTPEGTEAALELIRKHPFKSRLMVFSAATNETRVVWQENVEKYLCADREEIQVEAEQPPIVICSF